MRKNTIEFKNSSMIVFLLAVFLFLALTTGIPSGVIAGNEYDNKYGFKTALSDTGVVSDAAGKEYTLKIIEDDPVPLSAGGIDYKEFVVPIVVFCILFVTGMFYVIWFNNHKKRISSLMIMGLSGDVNIEGMEDVSIFHPIKTIRFEKDMESRVVSSTAKGV
ncbi:MAG: hypothetical protein K6E98_12500 [Lachnospiraceae bacterium]|nr:hypothetical protein [Lachnospiraceae bacterium]